MHDVKLTLELTYAKAVEVLELIKVTPLGDHTEPVEVKVFKEEPRAVEAITTPSAQAMESVVTPGKITSMPAFGRTKEQVSTYIAKRAGRKEELDEEAEARVQRKIDKELKQTEKDVETKRKNDEVAAIQEEVDAVPEVQPLPKKPWEL